MSIRTKAWARMALFGGFTSLGAFACRDDRYDPMLDAGKPVATVSVTAPPSASTPAPPQFRDAGVSSWDGAMPERPIPKGKSTVTSGMPPEIQLRAIGYMNAMGQPRFDDAWIDESYVTDLVAKLKPINVSFDRGSPGDQSRLNRIDVFGKGRKIELLLARGCSEDMPKRAVVQRAGASFDALKSHGVLVLACHDQQIQCLQSTRDPEDVICTTAPRHK